MKSVFCIKKIISLVLAAQMCVLLTSAVSSAKIDYDYIIEGEDFVSSSFVTTAGNIRQSNELYSKKKYLNLYTNPSADAEFYAEYDVEVSSAGLYSLDIASTPLGPGWSSQMYIKVNDGDELLLRGDKFAAIENDTRIAWYHANTIYLKDGNNKIRIIVKDRNTSNGYYTAFIDCFTLTKGQFALYSVSTKAPFGVFQKKQEVSVDITANGRVVDDTVVAYEVIDYLGKTINTGKAVIKKDEDSVNVKLGRLPKGHYSVIGSSGVSSVTGYFSVVTDLSERKKYDDTPFGIDAMPYGIYMNTGRQFLDSYIDLLELSGVTWVRDRVYFSSGITPTGDSYKIELPVAGLSGHKLREKNIHVSQTFNTMARNIGGLMLDYSTVMPTDLIEMYKFWKALAEQYDGAVTVWEAYNEFDMGGGGSNSDGPDLYSSVLKAMAIGVSDADTQYPVYLTSEPASTSSGPYYSNKFIEMMFENDLFDYAAIDNYHSHRNAAEPYDVYYSTDEGHVMKKLADAYRGIFKDYNVSPLLWNTESGIYLGVPKEDELNSEEQAVQAKYVVTSSIESISYGSDKHFYFCGPDYQEGSRQWGMTSRSKTIPTAYTSWPAISALTYVTGEGDYMGYLTGLPEGIKGYAFKDGEATAFVFWAEKAEAVGTDVTLMLPAQKVEHYDFFANKDDMYSLTGSYTINVSDFPSYIKYTGEIPEGLVANPDNIKVDKLGEPNTYTDAERVIITQKYSDEARIGTRMGGYTLSEAENKITVEVTNLNSKPMVGVIKSASTAAWKIEPAEQSISVEPMSTAKLEFTIMPDGFASIDTKLTFWGEFEGGRTSRSCAYCKAKPVVSAQPVIKDGKEYIKVMLENISSSNREMSRIEMKANDNEYSSDEKIVLPAQDTTEILIPVSIKADEKNMDIDMKAYFTDGSVCSFSSSIRFAIINKNVNTNDSPTIVLPDDGEIISAMYYGEEDLSAKIWLAADEKNFYMTADVLDNMFSQNYTGSNIWQGDGFQFSIGKGLPSVSTKYAELGVADTPEGAELYCWTNQLGGKKGSLNEYKPTIKRSGMHTIYEVAVPWSAIPDVSYDDDLMCFSLLLNENDGAGRIGYIEWGSGIGSKKEPAKFRTILFKK